MAKNKVLTYIETKRNKAIDLTKQLVRIPTVNPPGQNYEDIIRILKQECERIGLATRVFKVPKSYLNICGITTGSERINLVAYWKTGARKTLHISGHYDVVPVSGKWKFPPFAAKISKGRIYGRGAEDMKGTLAAMILAAEALKKTNTSLGVNIELSFCPDEEIGGRTGFGWLVARKLVKADYGLSEGYAGNFVSCGNKGIMWLKVTLFGKSAHASYPHRGIDAFDNMLLAAEALKKLRKKIQKRKTNFRTDYELNRYATMVMGGELKGGQKVNMVSDKVSFSIDRRLIPEENLSAAYNEIKETLEDLKNIHGNLRFKIDIIAKDKPVVIEKGEPIAKAIDLSIREILGKPAQFAIMPGSTDMRYLIKKGIPSVGYSAKGGMKWHSANEFVSIDSILDTAKIYALTALNL